MPALPPMPGWQAIHPLIVHFPIALLLVAPLFIAIGAARKPERSFPFLLSALILMALGTASIFAAVWSGEASGPLAGSAAQAKAVLERHEELAENTAVVFSALTFVFAAILFVPRLLKREPVRAISTFLPVVFLVLYATGAISLANAAHEGGRLVHELGVRAPMQPGAAARVAAGRE